MREQSLFYLSCVLGTLLFTACIFDSDDSGSSADKDGYLYAVNLSTRSIRIDNTFIGSKRIPVFWELEPEQYAYITVDHENVQTVRQYRSGTKISFFYKWEAQGAFFSKLASITLDGTQTVKFRNTSSSGVNISMTVEDGDTRFTPQQALLKPPLHNDNK